jgi:hypothetical protein
MVSPVILMMEVHCRKIKISLFQKRHMRCVNLVSDRKKTAEVQSVPAACVPFVFRNNLRHQNLMCIWSRKLQTFENIVFVIFFAGNQSTYPHDSKCQYNYTLLTLGICV